MKIKETETVQQTENAMGIFDFFQKKRNSNKSVLREEYSLAADAWKDEESLDLSISKETLLEETKKPVPEAYVITPVAEPISNEQITKGNWLLNTYIVTADAIKGGMGSVWKVHHKDWNTDLAMKRPQPKFFAEAGEKTKENFIQECNAWINLGLHPNIVSCYYVREIGGVPTIFSEWMENGSLKNRIDDGSLYDGTEEVVQERLLDIAIQFARGLHYAHESEDHLIHQDVKPDNLLLTSRWEAKVADFGLARARSFLQESLSSVNRAVGEADDADAGVTHIAPSGGYTPAYCSPEQSFGRDLTRRTDIYSWAVSVMEMYLGRRLWKKGSDAGTGCRSYFESSLIPMPEDLKVLLAKCMESSPEQRQHDFGTVIAELKELYAKTCGKEYPRKDPAAAPDTAESLNNRALSFLDLGDPKAAEECWERALDQNKRHIQSVYNDALYQWRKGLLTDLDAWTRVEACRQDPNYGLLMTRIELERGNPEGVLPGADPDDVRYAGTLPKLNMRRIPLEGTDGWKGFGEAVSVSPDGKAVLTAHAWKHINYIPLSAERPERSLSLQYCPDPFAVDWKRGVFCVYVSEEHQDPVSKLYVRDAEDIREYDLHTMALKHVIPVKGKYVPYYYSSDGKIIYIAQRRQYFTDPNVLPPGTAVAAMDSKDGRILCSVPLNRGVSCLALSPDEKLLAVGYTTDVLPEKGTDEYLVIYDAASLTKLRVLETPEVDNAVFSQDGRILYSCSKIDHTNQAWDPYTGIELKRWKNTSTRITGTSAFALNSAGTLLAANSGKEAIQLFNTENGRCMRTITMSGSGVVCFTDSQIVSNRIQQLWIADIPEFSYAASWELSRIRTIDEQTERERIFQSGLTAVEKAFNEKNYKMAMDCLTQARKTEGMYDDPRAVKWNRILGAYGKRISLDNIHLKYYLSNVYYYGDQEYEAEPLLVHFSDDEERMLLINAGRSLLFDMRSGDLIRKYTEKPKAVRFLGTTPVFFSGYRIYNAETQEQYGQIIGHKSSGTRGCFSPDGSMIGTVADEGHIFVHRVSDGTMLCEFKLKDPLRQLYFFSDGEHLLMGTAQNRNSALLIASISQKRIIRRFLEGMIDQTITEYSVDPSECCVLTKSREGNHILADIKTGEIIKTIHDKTQRNLRFTGFGMQTVSKETVSRLLIAPSPGEDPEQSVSGNYEDFHSISVSPKGRYIVVPAQGKKLYVYETDWKYEL